MFQLTFQAVDRISGLGEVADWLIRDIVMENIKVARAHPPFIQHPAFNIVTTLTCQSYILCKTGRTLPCLKIEFVLFELIDQRLHPGQISA